MSNRDTVELLSRSKGTTTIEKQRIKLRKMKLANEAASWQTWNKLQSLGSTHLHIKQLPLDSCTHVLHRFLATQMSWLIKFWLRSWGSPNSEQRCRIRTDSVLYPSPTDPSVRAAFGPTTSEESTVLDGVSNCLPWILELLQLNLPEIRTFKCVRRCSFVMSEEQQCSELLRSD